MSAVKRDTLETQIELSLNLDGSGVSDIRTEVGFLDHMLTLFVNHAVIDLNLTAHGDLDVDAHHTVEDIGIVLGEAFHEALGTKKGIHRYGHFTLPMDETLLTAAVDFCGRPCFVSNVEFKTPAAGTFDLELFHEFWQAFTNNARCNLHLLLHYGRNSHHISEAAFKGTARAVRMAVQHDERRQGIPSTKGKL
jgi:imidazoleglycerol-phosphate dehydratase